MKDITIAIDGHSSCGKSTMAKDLAKEIGYTYVDSGAMYRAVTLYCLRNGLIQDGEILTAPLQEAIDQLSITFSLDPLTEKGCTYLNNENVEKEIRNMNVSSHVSLVSALPFVRKAMVKLQQAMGQQKKIVMDGRDIGTTVFPDAEMKIFVTASPAIRAQRRLDELKAKGEEATFEEVLKNVEERDYIDIHREESPLRQASDAHVLDNSHLTIAQQKEWLLNLFQQIISK